MSTIYLSLILISGISFIIYGIALLISKKMQQEFTRFGLEKFTKLIGILELLGGIGVLIGIKINVLLIISSFGLSLLMFLGVITRIRMKDNLMVSFPSILFTIINLFILYLSL